MSNLFYIILVQFGLTLNNKTNIYMYKGDITDSKLRGLLIDSDLHITKDVDIELTLQGKFLMSNFILNDNQLYFIATEEQPASQWYNKEDKKYSFSVINYDLKTGKEKKENLKVVDQYIGKLDMRMDAQNHNTIYITGNYMNSRSGKVYKGGVMFIKLKTPSLEQTLNFQNDLSNDAIVKLDPAPGGLNPIYSLKTSNIIELPDGGIVITLQRYDNTIYVQFINKNGKLEHSANVTVSRMMGLSGHSFFQFYKNNTLYLVMNDSKKNLDLPDPHKLKEEACDDKNVINVIIGINNKGEWTKKQLFERDKESKIFYPLVSYLTKPNQIITFMQKGKNVQFLKFNY